MPCCGRAVISPVERAGELPPNLGRAAGTAAVTVDASPARRMAEFLAETAARGSCKGSADARSPSARSESGPNSNHPASGASGVRVVGGTVCAKAEVDPRGGCMKTRSAPLLARSDTRPKNDSRKRLAGEDPRVRIALEHHAEGKRWLAG